MNLGFLLLARAAFTTVVWHLCKLRMATMARLGSNEKELQRCQMVRVVDLANNLAIRLDGAIEGGMEEFLEAAKLEAISLRTVGYGDVLLMAVGRIYENCAVRELGGFAGAAASFKAFGRSVTMYYGAAKAAMKVMKVQEDFQARMDAEEKEKLEAQQKTDDEKGDGAATAADGSDNGTEGNEDDETKSQEKGAKEREDAAKLEQEAMPSMLEAMSSANVIDVTATLKEVCARVLKGGAKHGAPDHSAAVKKDRATVLRQLGVVFQLHAESEEGKEVDVQERVQAAAQVRLALALAAALSATTERPLLLCLCNRYIQ